MSANFGEKFGQISFSNIPVLQKPAKLFRSTTGITKWSVTISDYGTKTYAIIKTFKMKIKH